MNDVKVRRADLIARIRKNRDEHRELFLKAQDGFRARVIEELDAMLAEARDGKPVRTAVRLKQPEDHTKEYDRAIEMLDMSTEDEVMLDYQNFVQLVRNEWAWFGNVTAMNTLYASGGKLDL